MNPDMRTTKLDAKTISISRLFKTAQQAMKQAAYAGLDPELRVEQIYHDLQSHLIQVRQAVAQAINTEKQIEEQLQKEKDLAETWSGKATGAEQENESALVQEARQRLSHHHRTVEQLKRQLTEQKSVCSSLQQNLFDIEIQVQENYVNKQLLFARHKTAKATLLAKQLLAMENSAGAEIEAIVAECEKNAAEGKVSLSSPSLDEAELAAAITTLQRTIDAITKLGLLVAKRKNLQNVENNQQPPDAVEQ